MKKFFIILLSCFLPIILHLCISSKLLLKDPPIWPDEPYFVNISEHWITNGSLQLDIYRTESAGSLHVRAYSYPPLYYYILGLWIRLTGNSIVSLRLLSVFGSVLVLVSFFAVLQLITHRSVIAGLGTLSLILFGPFGMASRVVRWDIWVLLCLVLTILILLLRHSKRRYFFAGIVSMLGILIHPLGALCIITSVLFLISDGSVSNRLKTLMIYSIPIVLGILCWFGLYSDRFDLFISQMQIQFGYKAAREPLISLLFERSVPWRAILLLDLFLASSISAMGLIQKNWKYVLLGVGTYIGIIVNLYTVDQWYFIFIPVFPIVIAAEFAKRGRLFVLPLLTVIILHGLNSVPFQLQEYKLNTRYDTFVEGLSNQIPPHSTVVSSTVPDPYFGLRQREDLTLYEVPHVSEPNQLSHLLDSADVVIYNYATNSELEPYIQEHTQKKITVMQEDGYQADVIFLKH